MKQIVLLQRALSPSMGHDILLFPEGNYQSVSLHNPAGTIFHIEISTGFAAFFFFLLLLTFDVNVA